MQLCWRPEWIKPFESAWSVFEKLSLSNHVSKKTILFTLGNERVKAIKHNEIGEKYRDLYTISNFDHERVNQYLQYDLKSHLELYYQSIIGVFPKCCGKWFDWFHSNLHWCSECIKFGYHSVLHQFKLIKKCPIHLKPLENRCPECNNHIRYIFMTGSRGGHSTCNCGQPLYHTSDKWHSWSKFDVEIKCQETLNWLKFNNAGSFENQLLFIPERAFDKQNPISLIISTFSINLNSQHIKTFTNKNINRIQTLSGPNTVTQKKGHLNSHAYYGTNFQEFFEHLNEQVRQTFKAVDKHIKKNFLQKHKNCVLRFSNLLKVKGETFPEICPYAYAYVYWRQTLLGTEHFYQEGNHLFKKIRLFKFEVIGDKVFNDFEYIYNQFLSHTHNFSFKSPGGLFWIINKITGTYFLQFFKAWLELANQYSSLNQVPRKNEILDKTNEFLPFMVFKHETDLLERASIECYISNNPRTYKTDLKCPYISKKMKRINNNEVLHIPLRVAQMYSSYNEQIKYVDQYINNLVIK